MLTVTTEGTQAPKHCFAVVAFIIESFAYVGFDKKEKEEELPMYFSNNNNNISSTA